MKHASFKKLVEVMKSELSGNYRKTVVALMTDPILYLATELHDAMKVRTP